MTIEGNWIRGALTKDFPNIKTKVVELPGRPGRQGHAAVQQLLGHRGQERAPGARRSTWSSP